MSDFNKNKDSVKIDNVNWKWIILTLLIICSANFFSGFIISFSLKIVGLDVWSNYEKVKPFLTLISYFFPFIFITIITLFQKFNWKHIFYITIFLYLFGILEQFLIGQKTLTFGGMVIHLISTFIILALGKLFADLIRKVNTKFFKKKID